MEEETNTTEPLDLHDLSSAIEEKDLDKALWALASAHIQNLEHLPGGDRWTITALSNLGKHLLDMKKMDKTLDEDDREEMLAEILGWKNKDE